MADRRSIGVDLSPNGDVSVQLAAVVRQFLGRVGATARARAQQIIAEEMRDRSGRLRTRTNFEVKVDGQNVLLEFYNDAGPYAGYQEYGTGIYGPKGTPIRPKQTTWKNGRPAMLTWVDPDTGQRIFAREVRGVPPKRFMHRAIEFAIDQEVRRMQT